MCSIPVCLKTLGQSVVICVERVPMLGDIVRVTKDNIYRGGGRWEVPGFNPGNMIGKKWRLIKGLQSNDVSTFFVAEEVG